MRSRRFGTSSAVRNRNQLINPARLDLAPPDIEQRSDHTANLSRQKRVTDNVDFDDLPPILPAGSAPDPRPVNPPNGSTRTDIARSRHSLAESGKTGEIVLAFEPHRSVQHAHDIERPVHLQALRDQERVPWPDPDSIPVVSPPGISSWIERRLDSPNLQNRNVGRQLIVKCQPEPRRLQITSGIIARGNLPQCVHPRVGATGHRNLDRPDTQPGNRVFQVALDRSITPLALRARELRPIVRENQLELAAGGFSRRFVGQIRR